MSFKLLSISSMYDGYLGLFYKDNPDAILMNYTDNYNSLLKESTEFAASYMRHFRNEGIEADCIICNDKILQDKWAKEHNIVTGNSHEILLDQIRSYAPEVIYIENLSYVSAAFIRRIRETVKSVRLVAGNHGAPFNSKVLDSIKGVDFVITCTPGLKAEIEELGVRSYLVYHGFDISQLGWLDKNTSSDKFDFIFSGSLITGGDFHSKRIQLIQRILDEDIPIELFVNLEKNYRIRAKQGIYHLAQLIKKTGLEDSLGKMAFLKYGRTWVDTYSAVLLKHSNPPVFGKDMLNLFMMSKIVLNFHIGIAGDYAGNMRMFEVTGVGSCLLTDNKRNISDLFDPLNEIVTYDSEEDCIEKAKWLLSHETERKRIAEAGHHKTITNHTVENRCKSVIDIMTAELKKSETK